MTLSLYIQSKDLRWLPLISHWPEGGHMPALDQPLAKWKRMAMMGSWLTQEPGCRGRSLPPLVIPDHSRYKTKVLLAGKKNGRGGNGWWIGKEDVHSSSNERYVILHSRKVSSPLFLAAKSYSLDSQPSRFSDVHSPELPTPPSVPPTLPGSHPYLCCHHTPLQWSVPMAIASLEEVVRSYSSLSLSLAWCLAHCKCSVFAESMLHKQIQGRK